MSRMWAKPRQQDPRAIREEERRVYESTKSAIRRERLARYVYVSIIAAGVGMLGGILIGHDTRAERCIRVESSIAPLERQADRRIDQQSAPYVRSRNDRNAYR